MGLWIKLTLSRKLPRIYFQGSYPELNSKGASTDEFVINHPIFPSSDAAPQLENVVTSPLDGSTALQLEEVDQLHVESPNEDLFHQFYEDPLQSSPLDVEVPGSNVDSNKC